MEEKKEVLVVVNEKETRVKTLEGEAKVEYKYAEEENYVTVLETQVEKGVVKNNDGKFPEPDPNKELDRQKVTITPTNNPFYKNRQFIFDYFTKKEQLRGDGEKFKLEEEKMTKKQKEEYREQIKNQRISNAKGRFGPK